MATLTKYPDPDSAIVSAVDGWVARLGVDQTWAAIRAGAGTHTSSNDTSSGNACAIFASATTDQWEKIGRGIIMIDTSALTAGASITAATLSIKGDAKADGLSIAPTINIYGVTPAAETSIAAADFSQFGTTPYCDTAIAYAAWNTAGYNDFVLNAAGLAAISKTGVTKFGVRNANYDVAAIAPTWSSLGQTYFSLVLADTANTTSDPVLVVTYTLPANANPGANSAPTMALSMT